MKSIALVALGFFLGGSLFAFAGWKEAYQWTLEDIKAHNKDHLMQLMQFDCAYYYTDFMGIPVLQIAFGVENQRDINDLVNENE